MIMIKILLLALLLTLLQASEIKGAKSLAVTVYNNRFAIVKDVREISFDEGRSDLYFTDVSSNIQTDTVIFNAVDEPESIEVFEQKYEVNQVDTKAILKKFINKEIEVVVKLGQNSERIKGIFLGRSSGFILKTSKGIEIYKNVEGVTLPSLPAGFNTVPTLKLKVSSQKAVTTDCEVIYRTTGFNWKSDYSLILDAEQKKADMGGWVTIDNNSGKRYQEAKLKLIAGDINIVSDNYNAPGINLMRGETMAAAAPLSFSEKSFSDFHMYTLSQTVTLEDNSQKQVEFIPKVYGIKVRKYNFISVNSGGFSQRNVKASNRIQISNSKTNKLGITLPKGTVRVFKEDSADGSLQFLGEDSIDHTPKEENITLDTGNAFDISADKIATNFKRFPQGAFQADLNLTIRNRKSVPAQIVVEINNYYGENNRFTWKGDLGLSVQKVSASKFKISRLFAANEQVSYIWNENYRK